MKKVIITGGTGAIGIAFIKKCIQSQTEIFVLCHKNSKRIENIPRHPLVKVIEMNLNELCKVTENDIGCFDTFYHLGWEGTFGCTRNDMKLQIKNIQYTVEAVELAQRLGCHTFIGVGSQAEYGRYNGILTPDTRTKPENGYGMAKLCAGQMSRQICKDKGIKHIWTRVLSVYGPYDGLESMVISSILKMLKGEKASFTKGEQKWDYLYCSDAAEALFLLGDYGADGKTYCIGSGKARQLKEYIYCMRDEINPDLPIGIGDLAYAENQVMHLQADIADLKADTGFKPRIDFKEGIKHTIDWVREMGLK